MTRIPPLPTDEWDDEVRAALTGVLPRRYHNLEDAGHALGTLVRNPPLAKAFLVFNIYMLSGSRLSPRVRELAILRVSRLRDSHYEFVHHTRLAAQAGITPEDIEDAAQGRFRDGRDDLDAAVLVAVDELNDTSRVSDATWKRLLTHLDERQCMDLVFTIGGYMTLAMAFNTFGLQLEEEN